VIERTVLLHDEDQVLERLDARRRLRGVGGDPLGGGVLTRRGAGDAHDRERDRKAQGDAEMLHAEDPPRAGTAVTLPNDRCASE
jgi:hypothetical protein